MGFLTEPHNNCEQCGHPNAVGADHHNSFPDRQPRMGVCAPTSSNISPQCMELRAFGKFINIPLVDRKHTWVIQHNYNGVNNGLLSG